MKVNGTNYDVRFCSNCKGRHVHYEVRDNWRCIKCKDGKSEWTQARGNYQKWLSMRSYSELLQIGEDVKEEIGKKVVELDKERAIVQIEGFMNGEK